MEDGRHVVVDVGTGDGRWLFRLARERPDWLCIGIDANLDGARYVMRRARRRPDRGGAGNLRFTHASAERLPGTLRGVADEVYVQYPWGSLLHAACGDDLATLARVGALLRPRGRLHVMINVSALRKPETDLTPAYAAAGLRIVRQYIVPVRHRSSWAGRLGQGRPLPTLCVEAEAMPAVGVGRRSGGQGK